MSHQLVSADEVELTPELMRLLSNVNRYFNSFRYEYDQVKHGQIDYWTARIDKFNAGDCDDYALSKRKRLIEEGVPYQCMFPTICTVGNEGHLVLIVRTDVTDLLLDNIEQRVVGVDRVKYTWWFRLDPVNKSWVALK